MIGYMVGKRVVFLGNNTLKGDKMTTRTYERKCFVCGSEFLSFLPDTYVCSPECQLLAEDPNRMAYLCKREQGYHIDSFEQYLEMISSPCSTCGLLPADLGNKTMYIINPKQPTVICRFCKAITKWNVPYALKSLSARIAK